MQGTFPLSKRHELLMKYKFSYRALILPFVRYSGDQCYAVDSLFRIMTFLGVIN